MPWQPKRNKIPSIYSNSAKNKLYDKNRPNSYQRGYDSSWKVVRKYHLENNPLCNDCLKEGRYVGGNEIHHIKKLAEFPHLRDDPNNLMTLCKSCHSKRTAAGE